ncbi:hypothetical protein ACFODZ_13445 [Marinicella sediminis]|uniref:DUF4013 domain-containing protein n=1 Tax=Marinicella sediminis TaxID=1792834 RepID=A0ABV7JIP3_9GAMM|nr:hypothetical protein [Marinicella sediminis]
MSDELPPFWKNMGYFFRYMQKDQLYFQITLLALANILLIIPSLIINLIISALLFLTSYKLAFEVLHTVASGHLSYQDKQTFDIDDKIGFKAVAMGVLQILIYLFVYRYDPPIGLSLLICSVLVTPAYLMVLSQTQSVLASFNPANLFLVMTRIGAEYVALLLFFVGCSALNLLIRYYLGGALPGLVGDVLLAWLLYFLLIFSFLVIGYVMYRHADELGQETIDTIHVKPDTSGHIDPIKDRIKELLKHKKYPEVIAIVEELETEGSRKDLHNYLAQAQQALTKQQRLRPEERLSQMVDNRQMKAALELALSYIDDGHHIKPLDPEPINALIRFAFENNRFNETLKLCRGFDHRYPMEHQAIVDHFFLVAKIYYQNKRQEQSKKLLQSLISKYQNTTNINAVKSYLKGIEKLADR